METKHIDYGKIRPTIDDNWSKDNSYELLTFIKNNSKLYISKKDVPAGVELTNEDYWDLLIDGGDVSEKENKSNKKDSINYTDENFYPNCVAVKSAIDALHIENKLKSYDYINDVLYIENPDDGYLIHAYDPDASGESDALYYIAGLGGVCINDTLGVNEIALYDDEDTDLQYLKLDFCKTGREIRINVIPVSNYTPEIYVNLDNVVKGDDIYIVNINSQVVEFTATVTNNTAFVPSANLTEIFSAYNNNNKVRIRQNSTTKVEDVIGIDTGLNVAFTRDWVVQSN